MDIKMASGFVNTVNLVSTNSGNKLNMPVSPSMSPYAQYKYVRGVPSWNEGRTVSVSKLRVLNNLIDSLHELKSQKNQLKISPGNENLSNEAIDAMIEQYSSQLHQAMKKTVPVFGGQAGGTGMAFSISV